MQDKHEIDVARKSPILLSKRILSSVRKSYYLSNCGNLSRCFDAIFVERNSGTKGEASR